MHRDEQALQAQKDDFMNQKESNNWNEELADEVLGRPNVQPITQICEGDTVEFAINFSSM